MSVQYTTLNPGDEVLDYTRKQPTPSDPNKHTEPYDDRLDNIRPTPQNNTNMFMVGIGGFIFGAIANEFIKSMKK